MVRHVAILFALSIALYANGQTRSGLAPAAGPQTLSTLEVLIYSSNGDSLNGDSSSGEREARRILTPMFLSGLPQVSLTLKLDENFPELPAEGMRVTGIELDTLVHAVEPNDPSAVAIAICRDGYTSPFPRQALDDHHPILVLTIEGLTPHAWAAKHHTYDPSPYFIVYQDFVPSFHVLAHDDRPQHPAEIVRIKILPASLLFTAITPPDVVKLPLDSPVTQGFRIAQQNCFRCHNSGETGGTKAHRNWQYLGEVAKTRPDFFAAWVQNPQSIDPQAKMPANLKYDQATFKALTRYFETFAPKAQPSK